MVHTTPNARQETDCEREGELGDEYACETTTLNVNHLLITSVKVKANL